MNNIQAIYQAPLPQSLQEAPKGLSAKICKAASAVLGYISGSRALASLLSGKVHEASSSNYVHKPILADLRQDLIHNQGGVQVQMKTPDDHLLDGVIFRGDVPKAVVLMPGTGDSYETDGKLFLKFIRQELGNVTVFVFNPRGVGDSQGPSAPDKLRLDAYTAIQYLVHSENFALKDVLSYEFSLGGAYGNEGALLSQEESDEQQSPVVFVENSFADLESVIQAHAGNGFAFKIAKKLLDHYDWGLKSRLAWERLQGPKALIAHAQDSIIPPVASLYTAFPDDGILVGEADGEKNWRFHLPAYRTDLERTQLIGKKLREMLQL